MENFRLVKQKLQAFISKFYKNKLLKGTILFMVTGLLYFLAVLAIEYFFWLSTTGRSILFWVFIAVEVFLMVVFILIPAAKLFRLSKGLSEEEASEIIGNHFPEVEDKLLNLLQLNKSGKQSDLLLAGIDQKASEIKPVPFNLAIDFNSSLRYLKWAVFPLVIVMAIYFTGNSSLFADSYVRIVDYNTAYEPPAPFYFSIENDELETRENSNFILRVRTVGEVQPGQVSVRYNNNEYFLKEVAPGTFEYEFSRLKEDLSFQLVSNEVISEEYSIKVLKIPSLLNLEMQMEYPAYTGRQNQIINGSGNATVPEGSKVIWNFNTRETNAVNFVTSDSSYVLSSEIEIFKFQQNLYSALDYEVNTSNQKIKNFEPVSYRINIIKDEYPEIEVSQKTDSIDENINYYFGKLSDDYGLSKLQLVYYKEDSKDSINTVEVPISKEAFDEFLYTFPGDLNLERGTDYQYYFEVFDNDGVNGAKNARSEVFGFRKKTLDEIEQEKLIQQGESIDNLNKSLEEMENSREELNELSRLQKESENLNYNERKKLEEFLERQKQQNDMMKNYSEKLEKSLEDEEGEEEVDAFKEELKKRLKNNEKGLEENEDLMKELQEIADKINREELGDKLEELSKRNQSEKRNMEQLLELTKRYYVEEKNQKLARDLENLAKKQEELSEDSEDNTKENQEELSEEFEDFREEMEKLEEDNKDLKDPVDLNREEIDEESIKKDQKNAEEELEKDNSEKARQKQKDAAKKMQQISANMQQQMMMQSGEQLDADIESLRQILDNLVRFSFQQEELMDNFREMDRDHPMFAQRLKTQSDLRENFRHIDDSLYALALKNPMINEEITGNLTDIEFDMEKSLERLAENELPQGISSQQYVVTGANNLAYLLSEILSSMQQQANPQLGKGSGDQDFQLPDIIQKQEELQQQLQEGMEKKKQGEGKPQQQGYGQEQESEDVFEIYKQQQELRKEMEKLLEEDGNKGEGEGLKNNMQELEEQLLDKGFEPESLERMTNLMHELLELEKARLQQGEDDKRKSETNTREFSNQAKDHNLKAKEYFNSTEILNRQILPLREIYKQKVKIYFERTD